MKTILFVVGSFRARSFNRQLAREAEALLAPHCKVEWLDFAGVPFMRARYFGADLVQRLGLMPALLDRLFVEKGVFA